MKELAPVPKGRTSIRTRLYQIVAHRCLNAPRSARPKATGPPLADTTAHGPLVAEVSQLVQGAVLALPADDPGALDVLPGALP